MKIRNYMDARDFLCDTQDILESNEAANNLMLGVCEQMVREPERFVAAPCLKTAWNKDGLAVAAIMTPPFKLVVYGHQSNLTSGINKMVKEIHSEGWAVPGVLGPGETPEAFARAWEEIAGQPYRLEMRQRVYRLDTVNVFSPVRGRMRLATDADLDRVSHWFYAFYDEIGKGVTREDAVRLAKNKIKDNDVFLWEDGGVVSIACKSRPTRRGISIILVYSPPGSRGKGYATACVSELGEKLLAEGYGFVTLFADLANDISNHVYSKIGFQFVIDYCEFTFLVT
ncbi:MAG: hypothetical protein JXA42_03820 [Anaerolineales bacterium]|nr:hypothetical protein [Anaerolineales bacterium]